MRTAKVLFLCLAIVFLLQLTSLSGSAQKLGSELTIIRVSGKTDIDEKGDLHTSMEWRLATDALYAQIRRNYPNPYMLLRSFLPRRATREAVNSSIQYNDVRRSIELTTDFLGGAVNKAGRWEVHLGKGTQLVWMENQKATFLQIVPLEQQMIEVLDLVVRLPLKASSISYEEEKGLLSYSLPERLTTGRCGLTVEVKHKPHLMAATYKLYGNTQIFEGSMWVAKTLFRNTGKCNIRDLKVSYRLGEYTDWSSPRTYHLLVPGGSVVDLYYPVMPSRTGELMTPTPLDLEVKYSYQEAKGNVYADSTSERAEILGINQIEFSSLAPEERSGSWIDNFSNVPLLAAWVTHLDPPVRAFAGVVSQMAGGVPAASDPQSAIAYCRAIYNLEVANGLAYQTPSGFLVAYSAGQDIKYPRDVLRDKSGTCVDLAILFASACEAVGLDTMLIVVPGHAFPVIILPDGRFLPVESTAVSGPQGPAPFEKAVELGMMQLSQLQLGNYLTVDVGEMRVAGAVSPELPRLEADVLTKWGWRIP